MRLFFDTEFTQFLPRHFELISIAVVADDGGEFYAEICDFDRSKCSPFVRRFVLPKLDRAPGRSMPKTQAREELLAWLAGYKEHSPVLSFDYDGGLHLASHLLIELPEWLGYENVFMQLSKKRIQQYLAESHAPIHHGLHDARAIRYAYRPLPTETTNK